MPVVAGDVIDELAGDLNSMFRHLIALFDAVDERVCPGHRHRRGHPAGHQLHQKCVQAAGGLVLQPAQITMPFHQQFQDSSVIISTDPVEVGVTERGDRD